MKRVIVITVLLLLTITNFAFAGQKYNAMEGRWETVPDSWENKYNAMEGTWSYQPKKSRVEYNAMEDKWDWDSGHGNKNK